MKSPAESSSIVYNPENTGFNELQDSGASLVASFGCLDGGLFEVGKEGQGGDGEGLGDGNCILAPEAGTAAIFAVVA
jgi:hypothetical protein